MAPVGQQSAASRRASSGSGLGSRTVATPVSSSSNAPGAALMHAFEPMQRPRWTWTSTSMPADYPWSRGYPREPMCGIVAVLRRPSRREPPSSGELVAGLEAAVAAVGDLSTLAGAADAVEAVDAALRGVPGVRALLADTELAPTLAAVLDRLDAEVARIERWLDTGEPEVPGGPAAIEGFNAALVRLKDGAWAVRHDRLRTARAVADLAGLAGAAPAEATVEATVEAYVSIQVALSALDRLEVRGRDSAGLHVLVEGHGLDPDDPEVAPLLQGRAADRLFTSMAVRAAGPHLAFVYKAAAEIGELGDNTRRLRDAIRSDALLRRALRSPEARATVLGHTRWASVGIISEANAHPLNQEEDGGGEGPYVAAALNGDVDNQAALKERERLRVPLEVTTDAKVIPVLVSHRLSEGAPLEEAFASTARTLQGSVAVAAVCGEDPSRLLLALRGSGQALYVGLAEDAYVVASEPYGLVEETSRYVRMDGEGGSPPGQVLVVDGAEAGTLGGIRRLGYDGAELPVRQDEVRTAEITTRDVDRGGYPHYLLKEMSEAPQSVQKTLRGRLVTAGGRLAVVLGEETLPAPLRARLRAGQIRRIVTIGQGTAGVAGQALPAVLGPLLAEAGVTGVRVDSTLATELSGFGLADDMSDTLAVAVSQSGTTTDTNRTVDLVRARGGTVLAIVNRRNSDLVEKVDGVLYTSDGRDVEMAVPSTKAFYAQVAACVLLAVALAEELATTTARSRGRAIQAGLLAGLRDLPAAMAQVLQRRAHIAAAAHRHAPPRRYWAVVGNGANRIAAEEVRIKLSELCYKSIACDLTEDKKHIDLSSEPLILVCAAGLPSGNADDVAKEIAIYGAHKAAPIVVTDDPPAGLAAWGGPPRARFDAAVEVLTVPAIEPSLAFVLAAMAGHLFGYEAALAIDAQARPLREIRAGVESVLGDGEIGAVEQLRAAVARPAAQFLSDLQAGRYDGHLEASTALRTANLLRHVSLPDGLEAYEAETGRVATPSALFADLTDALTKAIGELTRPVDAIKHQAKTVTVGISRSEEALYGSRLVQAVLGAGATRDRLGYRVLRTLAGLEPAVEEVTGWTRYQVEGRVDRGATVRVVDRGGIATAIPTRTDADPRLRGSKHRAATLREVLVARGGADQRTVVIVPEVKEGEVTGLSLLHARFVDRLDAATAQAVLIAYLDRYDALVDAVTEREPAFDEDVLGQVPIVDLLTQPVHVLAGHWQQG
jgi:glutamine---fructose-6-phosphate transaminase (isomerizing)